MSRSAGPPANFQPQPSSVTSTPASYVPQPPPRQYAQNPWAAQTPPPSIPPGMPAGPPNGMSPSEWFQNRYMSDKERKQQARVNALRQILQQRGVRTQPQPQAAPATSGAPQQAAMVRGLRALRVRR